MNKMLEQMIQSYAAQTVYDKKNALKEVMQELVLCGLSRGGFFKEAAFYGGTALRIFYGLDRFSEDLDFSLMDKNPTFDLAKFFPPMEKEVRAYGLNVKVEEKEKMKSSNIQSAFLKGNTKEHMLLFYEDGTDFSSIPKNEIIKIKFEVDVNPPQYAKFERKYRLRPVPYEVNMYDEASLFSGKLHALLGRSWKHRVKGRDLYDYVFYLTRGIPGNFKHLRERLLQSGHVKADDEFSEAGVKELLCARFATIDYKQAKADVAPFIRDTTVLDIWSEDFFTQITDNLQFI